jgi:hypothetical protein
VLADFRVLWLLSSRRAIIADFLVLPASFAAAQISSANFALFVELVSTKFEEVWPLCAAILADFLRGGYR